MMRGAMRLAAVLAAMMMTGGCVRTAWNVATSPVKAVGKTADLMTTSPKERDEKYTRRMRKEEERQQKEERERQKECRKHPDRCRIDA